MKNIKEQDPVLLGKKIIACIQEKKGLEIATIDLTKTDNSVCESFIITHADSGTQVRAIARHIEESLKQHFKTVVLHSEGYENAHWILLDYNSVVVHVFLEHIREYYKLEELWADAEIEMIRETEVDLN